MKKLVILTIFFLITRPGKTQFTIIPTFTNTEIVELALHQDTLLILGREISNPYFTQNYFAKHSLVDESLIIMPPPYPGDYNLSDLQVVDNSYYLLSVLPHEHNLVVKSVDRGYTWHALYDVPGALFTSLKMHDTLLGVMAGFYGANAITWDNDHNWQLQYPFSNAYMMKGIDVYGNKTIIILAKHSYPPNFLTAYLSYDRGHNWLMKFINNCLIYSIPLKLKFLDQDTVYGLAQDFGGYQSYLIFSYNGGLNWNYYLVSTPPDAGGSQISCGKMSDMYFDSPKHGYMVGYRDGKSIIAETNDYGQTWIPWVAPFNKELFCILNINDSIAYLGGAEGLLVRWNKKIPLSVILSADSLADTDNEIALYPNPAFDKIYFNFRHQGPSKFTIEILDASGRKIAQPDIRYPSGIEQVISVNVTELAKGLYFLKITSDRRRIIKRFIKF